MTQITITSLLLGDNHNRILYSSGGISVAITLGKELKCSDTYTAMLYDEELTLLGNADSESNSFERSGRILWTTIFRPGVWLPGNYFLLLRNGAGRVLRFNIVLDARGRFHVKEPVDCPHMSDEDVLSRAFKDQMNSWRILSRKPGARQFKRWVIERAKQNMLNEVRETNLCKKLDLCDNILVEGKTGCMPGSMALLLLNAANVEGKRKTADCSSLYDTTKNNPYEALNEFFEDISSSDNILSIAFPDTAKCIFKFYNISALTDNGGRIIMNKILCHLDCSCRSAVFCGTKQEIDNLLEQYPSIRNWFPAENRLSMEPYTRQEMLNTFFHMTEEKDMRLQPKAVEKICRLLSEAYDRGAVSNWDEGDICRYIEQNLQPAYCRSAIQAVSLGHTGKQDMEVRPEDIDDTFFLSQGSPYSQALDELHAMVGLSEIKQRIVTLSNRVKFYAERRQLGLQSSDIGIYHTILTGNPGTGKTTVARLLGKIYHSLGLLSKGEVVCVDRKKIIGRYIGETEENMKMILREARGNVLFVDEAYTLYAAGDSRDFGRHAVECLLDVLSMKNPDMLVIFAGYKKEMDTLMSMNPGLVGRFPYKLCFPDYTPDELMQIAENMLSADHYELMPEARTILMQTIRETVAAHSENFANARWVEQLVMGGIIPAMADRVSGAPHVPDRSVYQRIEAADVLSASGKFNAKTIELRPRTAVGFCA